MGEMVRHEHADLMHKYAEDRNLKIQYSRPNSDQWVDLSIPSFIEGYKYRIKPAKKQDVVNYIGISCCSDRHWSWDFHYIAANLKLTFDSETGKLKHAEVLNANT